MSVIFGCEEKNKTPILEERTCPRCGRDLEVFVSRGRVVEDSVCECGYVEKAQEPLVTLPEIKNTETV